MKQGRIYFTSNEVFVFNKGRVTTLYPCESCGKLHGRRVAAESCCMRPSPSRRIWVCMRCGAVFQREDIRQAHRCEEAGGPYPLEFHTCLSCGSTFRKKKQLLEHLAEFHGNGPHLARISEAAMGEGLAVCDRCGRVVKTKEVISIFHGPHGEKTDLCRPCSRREIV